MTAVLSNLVDVLSQAITPYEKYAAMRRLATDGGTGITMNRWFVLLGASIVFILTILLLVIRRSRIERQQQEDLRRFNHESNRHGLTEEERRILLGIVKRARLTQVNKIFTHWTAFDRGAAQLMEEMFAQGQNVVHRKKLNMTVNSIRAKLGFEKSGPGHSTAQDRRKTMTSRQIREGATVSISPANRPGVSRIEALVVENSEYELVLRPEIPVLSMPGDKWNVQCRIGPAIWEFDALTLVCGVEGLELNHSDTIRYVNRRRFKRAAVNLHGLVAPFPVMRRGGEGGLVRPDFVPCIVTEVSGPGLRIHSELELDFGERVCILFELGRDRIISDIAEVRGSRDAPQGRSAALELVGLDEACVNELVKFTNNVVMSQAKEDILAGFGKDDAEDLPLGNIARPVHTGTGDIND